MSRGEPAVASTGGPLAPPYCRNYNIIDSIIIIDCSSSCPSERTLRGPALDGTRARNGKKIYGFTERIRAILPRHVHTPPRVASLITTCVIFFLTNPKCNIAFSKNCAYDSSPHGISSRPFFKATLSRAVAYLQLFITSFFRTSREHDTGVSSMRVNVYVCIICSAKDVTFCQILLESLKYNVIIYEFKMFAHYLTIYSFKFYS